MASPTNTRTALITGASHGIGYEFARLFARDGYRLILVARDKESMDQHADHLRQNFGIDVHVFARDLSLPAAADELYRAVMAQALTVDVLINNAGFGLFGNFDTTDLAREVGMVQLNVTALMEITKLFLPGMKERKWGRILNVASTAAFQPGPQMAVYYATKAFVLSFSQAIGFELKKSGVRVSCLCPGPTKSGFQKEAHMEKSKLFKGLTMDAETVAATGYRGLLRGKPLIVPGMRNKILIFVVRFAPRRLVLWIVWRAQKEG